MKHKKLWFGLGIPVLLILAVAFVAFGPALPHKKVSLILPFAPEADALTGLIPMGETKFHPKPAAPHGHPGIDFGGEEQFALIAAMDGTVTKVDSSPKDVKESMYDIIIVNGPYQN